MDATAFAHRALHEARVQVIPLDPFSGGEGYIRLSYAVEDEVIEEGVARLTTWLSTQ